MKIVIEKIEVNLVNGNIDQVCIHTLKVCIVLAPPLVIEPTIVEESVLNDSINLEILMNEL